MVKKEPNFNAQITYQHYLSTVKQIINFIKLHRKARVENNSEKMAYIEYKLRQRNCNAICRNLQRKRYTALIHIYTSQIKVINYIEKEGFISPEFQNIGLKYKDILKTCINLTNKGILRRRNCIGISYEFNN